MLRHILRSSAKKSRVLSFESSSFSRLLSTSSHLNSTLLSSYHLKGNRADTNCVRYLTTTLPAPTPEDPNKEEKKTKKPIKEIVVHGIKTGAAAVVDMIKNPAATYKAIVKELNHYWIGTKLLAAEIRVAVQIVRRVFDGHELTRRERQNLQRTVADIFRLVPMLVFVIVPLMEFLLPVALKLFPNMLPSTFQDKLKKEEDMKKELQMRIAMAKFLHETLENIAHKRLEADKSAEQNSGAKVIGFLEKLKYGGALPNSEVLEIATLFKDELTLSNIARPQLISLCQYMGLQTFGSETLLRFRLRNKMKRIKEDDRRILWEGIESLTVLELQDACRERGMRAHGLNTVRYQKQLRDWLDLSIQKNVPISLLIMSRSFSLASPNSLTEDVVKSSINALGKETINEVVLSVASPNEENSADMKLRKLESLQYQEELIKDEREEMEESIEVRKGKEHEEALVAAAESASPMVDSAKVLTPTSGIAGIAVDSVAADSSKSAAKAAATAVSTEKVLSEGVATVIEAVEEAIAPPTEMKVNRTLAPGHRGASEDEESMVLEETASKEGTESTRTQGQDQRAEVVATKVLGDAAATAAGAIPSVTSVATAGSATATTVVSATSTTGDSKKGEAEEELPDITVYELEAIGDLARTSAVQREKEALTVLQSQLEMLAKAPSKAKAKASGDATSEEKPMKPDKTISNLMKVLERMNSKLENTIKTTEKRLGDKLRVLDTDEDGSISVQELREGVFNTFKQSEVSEEDINELIEVLDRDKDGKVSVPELIKYVDKLREKKEEELLNAGSSTNSNI